MSSDFKPLLNSSMLFKTSWFCNWHSFSHITEDRNTCWINLWWIYAKTETAIFIIFRMQSHTIRFTTFCSTFCSTFYNFKNKCMYKRYCIQKQIYVWKTNLCEDQTLKLVLNAKYWKQTLNWFLYKNEYKVIYQFALSMVWSSLRMWHLI